MKADPRAGFYKSITKFANEPQQQENDRSYAVTLIHTKSHIKSAFDGYIFSIVEIHYMPMMRF